MTSHLNWRKAITFTAIASLLSACTLYPQPQSGEPQATLRVNGMSPPLSGVVSATWFIYDNACDADDPKSGIIGSTKDGAGTMFDATIRAGAPVFLRVYSSRDDDKKSDALFSQSWKLLYRFTPQVGKFYDVQLHTGFTDETVSIADHESKQAIPDLQLVSAEQEKEYAKACKPH